MSNQAKVEDWGSEPRISKSKFLEIFHHNKQHSSAKAGIFLLVCLKWWLETCLQTLGKLKRILEQSDSTSNIGQLWVPERWSLKIWDILKVSNFLMNSIKKLLLFNRFKRKCDAREKSLFVPFDWKNFFTFGLDLAAESIFPIQWVPFGGFDGVSLL